MEGENVKQRVSEICHTVIPEAGEMQHLLIDISHRIGRKEDGRIRLVIIRFTSQSTKETVWKNAKRLESLKSKKLRFGKDLTAKVRDSHNIPWPQVEAGWKERKSHNYHN